LNKDEGVKIQRKNGHISETVRDTAKVTINHYYKVPYALSNKMEIIDAV